MDSPVKKRHCAFCLNPIEDQIIKLCGKCRRRAYCSRECQVTDWSADGKGQGHKNWCHLVCGEEDIDWEVSNVPGKGLGVVAKRTIPAKYRIIVDCCRFGNDHRAIKDLMPKNGSYQEKYDLNCIGRGDGSGVVLYVYESRAPITIVIPMPTIGTMKRLRLSFYLHIETLQRVKRSPLTTSYSMTSVVRFLLKCRDSFCKLNGASSVQRIVFATTRKSNNL